MKQIDIRKQPRLGPARIFNLTLHGIQYRLFRSLVTVIVITVAVAFLMNILGESLIKRTVAQRVQERLYDLRLATRWASHLTLPGSTEDILQEVATAPLDSPAYEELQRFSGLGSDAFADYRTQAIQADLYLRWFSELTYTSRRRLVHRAEGAEIFDYLRDADAWDTFSSAMLQLKSLRLPTDDDVFQTFLVQWPELYRQTDVIRLARRAAIAELPADQPILVRLTRLDGDFGEAVRHAGFQLDPEQAIEIASQARMRLNRQFIEDSLNNPHLTMNKAIGSRLDILPQDVRSGMVWGMLRDTENATWFLNHLRQRIAESPDVQAFLRHNGYDAEALTAADLVALANLWHREADLQEAETIVGGAGTGFLGLGERLGWLVIVSLIVCTVGIANAMLMAVTERFREIATLKCLGALDSFIMLMFVLEACMLGAVGGLAGALAGLVIAILRMLGAFGGLLGGLLPWGDLILGLLAALVTGVLLAALAAIYPSFKAARLAPMEAMRIE